MKRTGPATRTDAEAPHFPGFVEETGLGGSGVSGPQVRAGLVTQAGVEPAIDTQVAMVPFLPEPLLGYGGLL